MVFTFDGRRFNWRDAATRSARETARNQLKYPAAQWRKNLIFFLLPAHSLPPPVI